MGETAWKMVPVEPTRPMREAVAKKMDDAFISGGRLFIVDLWDDMLAAAPEPPAPSSVEGDAVRDVLAERRRQIEAEGWTPEHDDEHANGEMAEAASCYASRARAGLDGDLLPPGRWPWSRVWWKPAARRRMLIKAGALILAEIERLDRLTSTQETTP